MSEKATVHSLFPIEPVFPEGFQYYEDFLSEAEELQLIGEVMKLELSSFMFHGFEAKRRVKSFGHNYHFDDRSISKGREIPQEMGFLVAKVGTFFSFKPEDLQHLLVTEYPPGSVINWHRDAPPFDVVIGVSLLSDCTFKLRPYEKEGRDRRSTISFDVKRRSLYVMRGEARDSWEHSIAPVKDTRYSITLRTLRKA